MLWCGCVCCVLWAGCWVLGAGCWVLGAGCCVLCAVGLVLCAHRTVSSAGSVCHLALYGMDVARPVCVMRACVSE
jgi:hypothetical protein